jgi:large subunit ribosomal protein L7e
MNQVLSEAPQSSLRKRQYEERMAALKAKQEKEFEQRKKDNARYAEETTDKLLQQYYQGQREITQKMAETKDGFYVPREPAFFAAVLIRSKVQCNPKQKKVLELLRLNRINTCVLLKNNKSIKQHLQIAKDYIAYGTIDMELLRKLVYTRGFGKNGKARVKLTNEFIEDMFDGRIKCIEEIVHHIHNGTEMFKAVNNFLWPFHLNAPLKGFGGQKRKSFNTGGSTGNHYDLLGRLLERMLHE